jgi:hypothetical protein
MLWPSVRLSRPADDQRGRLAAGEIGTPSAVPLSQQVSRIPDHHVDRANSMPGVLAKAKEMGSNTS